MVLALSINPFTAMMSLENGHRKINAKFVTLFSFSRGHVERLPSIKRRALKVDVIGPENIMFAGASVHLLARIFYR